MKVEFVFGRTQSAERTSNLGIQMEPTLHMEELMTLHVDQALVRYAIE